MSELLFEIIETAKAEFGKQIVDIIQYAENRVLVVFSHHLDDGSHRAVKNFIENASMDKDLLVGRKSDFEVMVSDMSYIKEGNLE